MKPLCFLFFLLLCGTCYAQKTKLDLAKDLTSKDRKEMIEALKLKLQPGLKLKPKMVVTNLWVKGGFAFFRGFAKDGAGKDIDFRKTAYREEVMEGIFDGDATFALLKTVSGKWKVLAFTIGATDVPYTCWWKEFKAPKEIFDYADKCQ